MNKHVLELVQFLPKLQLPPGPHVLHNCPSFQWIYWKRQVEAENCPLLLLEQRKEACRMHLYQQEIHQWIFTNRLDYATVSLSLLLSRFALGSFLFFGIMHFTNSQKLQKLCSLVEITKKKSNWVVPAFTLVLGKYIQGSRVVTSYVQSTCISFEIWKGWSGIQIVQINQLPVFSMQFEMIL